MSRQQSLYVRAVRDQLYLSQVLFGKLVGLHPVTVSKIERGAMECPEWTFGLISEIPSRGSGNPLTHHERGVLTRMLASTSTPGAKALAYVLQKRSADLNQVEARTSS